jgi:hypothetical protein
MTTRPFIQGKHPLSIRYSYKIVLLIPSLCSIPSLLYLLSLLLYLSSLHHLPIIITDLAHCRSMDQVFSIIRLSLTCVLILLLLTGLYLLYPTNIKINLIASNNAPKLVNGLTVLESAISWCPSLKEGFKPAWWLPK